MTWQASDPFATRVRSLPTLGVGISTEFGAWRTGLDLIELRTEFPELIHFLELGVDLERGIDRDGRAWIERGWPTTYHFLDVNLEEPADLDVAWIQDTANLAREAGSAWLCGDAGLWHVGPRDRGHSTLMPPVLEPESARAMADAVRTTREVSGLEVLPENPPAHVFVGRMHLCDYYADMLERSDSSMLLDVAHLAVYQHVAGHSPLTGLDAFPLDRVLEIHVAGGTPFEHGGRTFIDDDHGTSVLPETWEILKYVVERAPNLRAIVFECERNTIEAVLPTFRRLDATWRARA